MPSASIQADFAAAAVMRKRLASPITMLQSVGITPDPWQQAVLTSQAKQIHIFCGRQVGKSLITAGKNLHIALTERNSDLLIISGSQRQAVETLQKAIRLYQDLGKPVDPTSEARQTLELLNGSRLIALPGSSSTVRGFSAVAAVTIEEAAFTPDDIYYSVRPMLAVSGGQLILLSSAHGKRGFFYNEWKACEDAKQAGRKPPWEQYMVKSSECDRVPKDFLVEERRSMGEWWYRQEYECEFLDAESSIFREEDVMAALDATVAQWELPVWQ